MSVVKRVIGYIEEFVKNPFQAIEDLARAIWEEITLPILEFIVGIFGIEDETIIDIKMISLKVYEEEGQAMVNLALTKTAIDYTKTPERGALISLVENTSEAAGKISGYYNFAITEYPYALPTTNIRGSTLDLDYLKSIIDTELGLSVTIDTAYQRTISADVYYKYYLQENYSYLPYTNTLTFTDAFGTFDNYTYENVEYVINDDTYNINIQRVREVVKFYLTGPDEVNDGDTTLAYTITSDRVFPVGTSAVVTLEYSGTAVEGTHYTAVTDVTILGGSDNGTFSIDTIADSAAGGDVTLVITVGNFVVQDGFELQEIADINFSITNTIKASGAVPNVIDNTNAPAPEGIILPQVINRPSYALDSYVVATYHTTNSSEWLYWIYNQATNVYPTLQLEVASLDELEMMPIAILRTNNASVSPANIGQTNYDGVLKLVETIGLPLDSLISQIEDSPSISNVKEAFLVFAVDPKDQADSISAVLFEQYFPLTQTSSSLFNSTTDPADSLIASSGSYTATFEEQNVKRALTWTKQEFYVFPNVIGEVGKYQHYILDVRLFLLKQITPTQCRYIVLHNLSSVEFIEAGGLNNMSVSKLAEDNFAIPLSYFAVNQLSPLEQLELYPYALRINLYSVQVTELAWYETAAFMQFFQIVLIVVTVVITIFTLGTGTAAWIALAKQLVINYLITQIAIAIISSLDNNFAKAVVAALAIYAMVTTGDATGVSTVFSDIVGAVTMFADFVTGDIVEGMTETLAEMEEFQQVYGDRIATIEKQVAARDEMGIDVTYLAYLNSPSTAIYSAIQMQYDFSSSYNYDTLVSSYHDNALRLGVV